MPLCTYALKVSEESCKIPDTGIISAPCLFIFWNLLSLLANLKNQNQLKIRGKLNYFSFYKILLS